MPGIYLVRSAEQLVGLSPYLIRWVGWSLWFRMTPHAKQTSGAAGDRGCGPQDSRVDEGGSPQPWEMPTCQDTDGQRAFGLAHPSQKPQEAMPLQHAAW